MAAILSYPLSLIASALPKALLSLNKLSMQEAKLLYVFLDTFATYWGLRITDYFMPSVSVKDISMEFAPPYIYGGSEYSGNIDYFSICSILFRLMIGRLPYEGKGLNSFGEVFDPIRDVDVAAHEYYFEHYHQYPKFIFDSEDNSNSLGPMSENDLPKERWAELPDKIKEMFQESLSGYVQGKGHLYSPGEWLVALNQSCWDE